MKGTVGGGRTVFIGGVAPYVHNLKKGKDKGRWGLIYQRSGRDRGRTGVKTVWDFGANYPTAEKVSRMRRGECVSRHG